MSRSLEKVSELPEKVSEQPEKVSEEREKRGVKNFRLIILCDTKTRSVKIINNWFDSN